MPPSGIAVRRVLGHGAAGDQRPDLGQLLELVQELPALGAVAPAAQVLHAHDHAQRDAVLVGVEEAAAHHAPGALAHEELGGALAGVQVPAVLDDARRQLDDLLVAERVVPGLRLGRQPGRAAEQPQHALGDDDDARADLVAAGADADDAAVLAQQLVDLHVGHDHGALLGDLLGEPLVEPGAHARCSSAACSPAKRSEAISMVVWAPSAIIVTSSRATGRSYGRFVPELGVEAADGLHVQAPAGDVLGARVVAALEDHDLDAGRRPGRRPPRGRRGRHRRRCIRLFPCGGLPPAFALRLSP